MVPCENCNSTYLKRDLGPHLQVCPLAITQCPGSPYGCQWKGQRVKLEKHQPTCAVALLVPFLAAQTQQIAKQADEITLLKRKNDLHESTISAMQAILYAKPGPSTGGPTASSSDSETTSLDLTSQPSNTAAEPPFDTPTSHLLYLHESLRTELSRLETALGEVDARGSMMVMNESLRMREDMTQMNSAISTMRTQLHYLMSAELQRRAASAGVQGGLRGPGGGSGASGGRSAGSSVVGLSEFGMNLRRGSSEGHTKL